MNTFTRRSFLTGVTAFSFANRSLWSLGKHEKRIFIGTYTKKTSKGVYTSRWMPETGELVDIILAAETSNPSFLALSPNRKNLYAVNELDNYQGAKSGAVSAFSIGHGSGKLALRNEVPSGGTGPCNTAVDHTGQVLFVADYDNGSVATFRILPDGGLSQPATDIHYSGHSVDVKRQKGAHTHCTTVSPDNRYVLVNDLGLDRIMVYRFDPKTAILTPNDPPFYSAIPGSGPRNLAFHPNGRWAYSTNELGGTVDGLDWNSTTGTLTRFQNISTVPSDFKQFNAPAMTVVHPNGRFAYVSNRGHDSIAAYSVDPEDGHLTLLQYISCGGKFPRHFAVDPKGRWLIVANQNSANVVVLACNAHTGRLTKTGRQYSLDSPVCVVFE
ncbi:MAG TPA: lactonase family protein [Acidobacteriaceae bacterium]|jgi:6-phosphogluconolactonase|nr:lactonase family protein [Acidobacteriaceae bacterium]